MSVETELRERAQAVCELCGASENLSTLALAPKDDSSADHCVLVCKTCLDQINDEQPLDVHHWRVLGDSMWSSYPAVQVLAWRMLQRLQEQSWARDLSDMLYLDEETKEWAEAGTPVASPDDEVIHKDTNGTVLQSGDTITLIKDLKVKGAGFTAKRGTAVRNISLVPDTPEHIEGRVNGQQIVNLTEFVKKSVK
jgi:protein PhnA